MSNNAFTVADGLAEIIHARGVKNGDFVAVFMTNSPEMVFVLLALSKIGGIPALINHSLRSADPTLPFCGLSSADDCR
jgi:acyl-coenzyme A synthetase/AMP-(fatty) acid ligase